MKYLLLIILMIPGISRADRIDDILAKYEETKEEKIIREAWTNLEKEMDKLKVEVMAEAYICRTSTREEQNKMLEAIKDPTIRTAFFNVCIPDIPTKKENE